MTLNTRNLHRRRFSAIPIHTLRSQVERCYRSNAGCGGNCHPTRIREASAASKTAATALCLGCFVNVPQLSTMLKRFSRSMLAACRCTFQARSLAAVGGGGRKTISTSDSAADSGGANSCAATSGRVHCMCATIRTAGMIKRFMKMRLCSVLSSPFRHCAFPHAGELPA